MRVATQVIVPQVVHSENLSPKVKIPTPSLQEEQDKGGAPVSFLQLESLHKSLVQHCIGYFQEASDVGAVDEVAGRTVFLGRFEAVAVDVDHDFV